MFREAGQLDRPREETEEHAKEIERHRGEIRVPGIRAVAFHDVEAALDDVATDPDPEEFAVGADERRNSPGANNRERAQHSGEEPEAAGERDIAHEKLRAEDGEDWQPGQRAFGEES